MRVRRHGLPGGGRSRPGVGRTGRSPRAGGRTARVEERTGRELGADARDGDEVAIAAFARAGRALGIAIASAKALCDFEVVAIGGGVSQVGDLLFGPLQATLDRHTGLEFTKRLRVVPAALGQDAGLVGAAALSTRADRYWSAD